MAKAPNVSAPPPVPKPTPTPAVAEGEVLPVVEGEGVAVPPVPTPTDVNVPEGQGAGNLIPDVEETEEANKASAASTGEEVQSEIGGEPVAEVQNFDARDGAHVDFNPADNLGDWDGDGVAGGSAVAGKDPEHMTDPELGENVGIAYAQDHDAKPTRDEVLKEMFDELHEEFLPNGNRPGDEFWTAFDQAYDREREQLAADELSDEDRLRRVEKTLGLLSPRQ